MVGARLASEALSRPAVVRAATQAARASLSRNPVATRRALAALRAAVQAEGLLPKQPQQDQRQYAGPQNFEAAVRGDLQQQFPNESPEQIDRRVRAVVGQMTSGQTFLPEVQGGVRINQPNWENFLAAQSGSANIIDRRRP